MEDFIKKLQDLRHLDWENKKMSLGTPGCFLKAYEEKDGNRIYYKMSNYDSYRGIFGHEWLKFAIKNAYYNGKTVGYLYYDEQHRPITR